MDIVRFHVETADNEWSEVRTSKGSRWIRTADVVDFVNVTSAVNITFESPGLATFSPGFKFSWYVDYQRRSPVSTRCAEDLVNDNDLGSCQGCAGGQTADADQLSCVCPAGFGWVVPSNYDDEWGQCQICVQGTYSYNGSCVQCEEHFSTRDQGSSSRMQCLPIVGYQLHRQILTPENVATTRINLLMGVSVPGDPLPSETTWQAEWSVATGVSYAELVTSIVTSREDMLVFCTHFCFEWIDTRMFNLQLKSDNTWKCVCFEEGGEQPNLPTPYEWYWPTPAPCPVDTYKDTISASDCTPCPNSTTAGLVGVSSIIDCLPLPGYEWKDAEVRPCAPTHFKDTVGYTACQECAGGEVSSADRSECVCEPGYVREASEAGASGDAAWELELTGSLMTDGVCVPCEVGTYSNEANTACLSCRVGFSTTATASTSWTQCMPEKGMYSNTGTPTRSPGIVEPGIVIGTNQEDFDAKNTGVSWDTYSGFYNTLGIEAKALFALEHCSKWNPSTAVVRIYTNAIAGFTATCFSAGSTHLMSSDTLYTYFLVTPKPCPVDTYKASVSLEACMPCPEHSTTNGIEGATDRTDCLAQPGYEWSGLQVQQCGATWYKSTLGNYACSRCPIMLDHVHFYESTYDYTGCHCGSTAWHDTENEVCQSCKYSGQVLDVEYIQDSTQCKCGDNTYLGVGSGAGGLEKFMCFECPKYTDTNNVLVTMIIDPEASRENSLLDCHCPSNWFRYTYTGGVGCSRCPEHATSDPYSTAVTDCACDDGLYLFEDILGNEYSNVHECRECLVDTYGKDNICIACNDYYSTLGLTGQAQCTCLGDLVGDDCHECVRGKYYDSVTTNCELCPWFTYNDQPGRSACSNCDPGMTPWSYDTALSSSYDNGLTDVPPLYTAVQGLTYNGCVCNLGYNHGTAYHNYNIPCSPCAVGTYKDTWFENCQACPPRSTTAGQQSTKVADCNVCLNETTWVGEECAVKAGFQLSGDVVEPCPAGTYKDAPKNEACDQCAAGTFMQETGATVCTPCAAGKYNHLTGQSGCVECEAGSSAGSTGSDTCSLCAKGTFMQETGATACTPCAVGTYSDSDGLLACHACLHGSTTMSTASTAVEDCWCMADFFGSLVDGRVVCDACNANAVSEVGQNTGPADCKCKAGWFGNDGGVCEFCSDGKYKDSVGSAPCVDCTGAFVTSPAGSTTAAACGCQPGHGGPLCTACLPGKYKASVGFEYCSECAPNTFQNSSGSTECHSCSTHWVGYGETNAPAGSSRCYCRAGIEYRCKQGIPMDEDVCVTQRLWCQEYRKIDGNVCDLRKSTDESINCDWCACWPCPAGTFRPYSHGAEYVDRCIVCPAGKFSTTIGAGDDTPCTDCGPNTYSSPNGTMCLACPAGKSSGTGSGQCLCDAGFEFSNVNAACEPCRQDFFKPDASDRGCDKCAGGAGTGGVGALACDVSLPGYADISPQIASQVGEFGVAFDEDMLQVPKGSRFEVTPLAPDHFRTGTSNVLVVRLRVLPSETTFNGWTNLLSISHPDESGPAVAIQASRWPFTNELMTSVVTNPPSNALYLRSQQPNTWQEWWTVHIHYTVDSIKLHIYRDLKKKLYTSINVPITRPLPIGYIQTFEIGGSMKWSPSFSNFGIEISHMFFSNARDFLSSLELTADSFANCLCSCPSTGPSAGFVNVLERDCGITPCPAGTYKPERGAFRCLPCPVGATSLPASKALSDCKCTLPGYAPGPLGECVCAMGFERDDTACVECVAGKAGFDGTCELCAAGKFQDIPGQALCKPCARGSAQAATGQTACAACEPGHKQPDQGRQACSACAAGTFQALAGQTACAACEPGAYAAGGAAACEPCAAGSFQAAGEQTGCEACGPGTYQNSSGSTACEPCAPGAAQPAAGQAACAACGPGAAAAGGATECGGCAPGSYAAGGAAACEPCAAGSFQAAGEQTGCEACGPGTFQNASGAAGCRACREGWVAPDAGQTACAACAAGTFAAGQQCLPCAPGTYAGAGASACAQCAAGAFQDAGGQGECEPCPAGTASAAQGASAAATCVACGPGNHSGAGAAACLPCPPGTFSVGSACEPCAAGLFQPLAGAADRGACRPCLPPSYAQTAGSAACAECRNGTLLTRTLAAPATAEGAEPGGAEPVAVGVGCLHNCSAGERSGTAAGDYGCHPCPRGSAQPLALHRAGECTPCAPGQDTPGEGASACACARGWEPGLDACRTCTPPWFKNWVGDDPCVECRRERNELPELMTSAEKCPCAAGFFDAGLGRRCEACPAGAHTADTGSEGPGSCSVCLWLHMTNDCPGAGPCQCADGFVRTLSNCEFCPGCPCGSVERRSSAASRTEGLGLAWLAVMFSLYLQ